MKKLILKTALITVGITLVLAVSVFGIVSFAAPSVLMRLTDSLGMEAISGDYAYEEYARSGDLACLSRAFQIAERKGENHKAAERFETLYEDPSFGEFCEEQEDISVTRKNEETGEEEVLWSVGYRAYLCGRAACVAARLSDTDEEKGMTIDFAFKETESSFPARNPVVALAAELGNNKPFAELLLSRLESETKFDKSAAAYGAIVQILQKTVGGNV